MKPIYKGKTYQFKIEIKINNIPVDITNDEVVVYIDKKFGVETPAITVNASLTNGTSGIADFELTPAQTDLLTASTSYKMQAFWIPFGTTRKFPVADEIISVRPVIK